MYEDCPYAREVGHVGEATGVTSSAEGMRGGMGGHDVPPDVLTGVLHWMVQGGYNPIAGLNELRRRAEEGNKYCVNDGCEVLGHRKDFKVCPQCKTARAPRVRNSTGPRVGTEKSAVDPNIGGESLHLETSGAIAPA
jgi:hypothetical protein